jgi:phosphatidylglycerophosphatase A
MSRPNATDPTTTATTNSSVRKPRFAFAVATVCGLGYLPKAPGTFGSLAGVLLACGAIELSRLQFDSETFSAWSTFAVNEISLSIIVSFIGIWAASRVAKHTHSKDPQIVVVDEVAGQLLAYLGLALPGRPALDWKYLLAGFILFRVFDIWKPFPARQAESLPGGLGIMADDWIAGIYAALVLGIFRFWN